MAVSNIVYSYDISRDQWSRFTGFDIVHSDILSGVSKQNNVMIFTDSQNRIMEYPSEAFTETEAVLVTKKIPMGGRLVRRVLLDYDGGTPTLQVLCYNRRFPDGLIVRTINNPDTRKYYGLPNGLKCEYLQFKVVDARLIKSINYTIV